MISAHGSNAIAATAGVCITTAALLFGGMASEKRTKLRLYEKKYKEAVSSINNENQKVIAELRAKGDFPGENGLFEK